MSLILTFLAICGPFTATIMTCNNEPTMKKSGEGGNEDGNVNEEVVEQMEEEEVIDEEAAVQGEDVFFLIVDMVDTNCLD